MVRRCPLNPISTTAYWTLIARIQDAEAASPLCGDYLAKRFSSSESEQARAKFGQLESAAANIVARHRIIDDYLADRLRRDPSVLVVLLGAGFDTRAFRFGGGKWVELDENNIIAHKNALLPATQCPNPLTRISVAFERQPVEGVLSNLSGYGDSGAVIVVAEGVLLYLSEEQVESLINGVSAAFPNASIVCDLMSAEFFDTYLRDVSEAVRDNQSPFRFLPKQPTAIFDRNGFTLERCDSIPSRARNDFTTVRANAECGYCVYSFFAAQTDHGSMQ